MHLHPHRHDTTAVLRSMVAGLSGLALAAVAFGLPVAAGQVGEPLPQAPGAGRGGRGGIQGTPVLGPGGEVWGFTDTAFNPGSRWRIHDADRPQPPVATPGETVSIPPPSDAIVLFDGTDLSQWVSSGANGAGSPATWTVRNGYFEAEGGNLSTKARFGDVQLHLEYAIPADVAGSSQNRGNGGVTYYIERSQLTDLSFLHTSGYYRRAGRKAASGDWLAAGQLHARRHCRAAGWRGDYRTR